MLPGDFYHVFNHANGNEKLFREDKNYFFFLDKIITHILPVVKMHAYCLMPNHFHLLVEIKNVTKLKLVFSGSEEEMKDLNFAEMKVHKYFSNLFSSYTQSYNKLYNRMGSLFMQNFKQNEINSTEDYCSVIHYIHTNPVHHGFAKNIADWKFSSYQALVGDKKTLLERDDVLNAFGGRDTFLEYHQRPINLKFDIF